MTNRETEKRNKEVMLDNLDNMRAMLQRCMDVGDDIMAAHWRCEIEDAVELLEMMENDSVC